MRFAWIFSVLLCLAAVGVRAQQSATGQPTLTVRSTLVQVPVLVKTKGGQVVFALMADDFLLTDDGVPQHLTLDQDTDSQPRSTDRSLHLGCRICHCDAGFAALRLAAGVSAARCASPSFPTMPLVQTRSQEVGESVRSRGRAMPSSRPQQSGEYSRKWPSAC